MGRLFWKFFIIFWLAQFVASTSVGVMIWLDHRANGVDSGIFTGTPPPPGFAGDRPPPGRPEPGFATDRQAATPATPDRRQPPPGRLAPPLVPILAGSLVSLVFAALLAWYFARPIRTLRAAFASAADGRLETRIGTAMGKRKDELADLGQDFDHMASRLEKLIDTQRRLMHDVSHELRSPLARLQAAADLMLQQPERSVEFVARIQRDTARMDTLVGELLTLARLDAGMAGRLDDNVDIDEIIADVTDAAGFEAQSKACTIRSDLAVSIVVRGNHELLHRAIENVVRNAVRHSPPKGVVAIAAQAQDGTLRLTVSDDGPGVAPHDLAAIFEPFVRSAPEPSSTGHGLGLAIARRVAIAHGGEVYAENRDGGGLAVTFEIPLGMRERTVA